MMKLDNFIGMMTGCFDNKEQFNMMQATGKIYPYAKHVNTVCNDKINNIPQDFNGKFVVEESYYETNGKRHASPHLFLITENEDGTYSPNYKESMEFLEMYFPKDIGTTLVAYSQKLFYIIPNILNS